MSIKKSIIVSAIVLSSSMLFGAEAPKMPDPKVDVYIVQQPTDIAINLVYPAQIKPYEDVLVYARASGLLQKKYFSDGVDVKAGDMLYKIEDNIYQAQLDQKSANLKMNEAILNNAKRDWDRISKLYDAKVITDEKRDAILFAYEKAQAQVSLAKAELAQAKISLDYTNVKAPISGRVGLQKVDVGNLVSSTPPTPLVSITRNDKLYVDFSMPLSDYQNIKSGMWSIMGAMQVAVNVNGKEKVSGDVDFVDVNINKDTSTVKLRAVVDNKDAKLMAGDFVRVALKGVVQKDVVTIPQKSVLQNPQGTIAMIVQPDNKVGVRPVVLGRENGDSYILAGGALQGGDKVIVNNFFRAKPSMSVVVDKVINQQ